VAPPLDRHARSPRRVPLRRPGKTGGKRDENRKQKTAALCGAALRLFLERGVESVTIDEIVGDAGVSKGSFYRYFDDKTDLVDAILEPVVNRLRSAFGAFQLQLASAGVGPALNGLYGSIAASLAMTFVEHPDVVRLYLQESRGPDVGARSPIRQLADEVMDMTVTATEVAIDHGFLRPFDPRVTASAVVGGIERLLFESLSGHDMGDPAAVTESVISLVLDGHRK
jgi:AcrR family transcriptional regulator